MMYQTRVILVKPKDPLFDYLHQSACKAKLLRNACLFRLRNVEFMVKKGFQNLNAQQLEVLGELNTYRQFGKPVLSMCNHSVNYNWLDYAFKTSKNADYYSGLSLHAVQHIIKTVVRDFKSYKRSLQEYAKDPSKFTGEPKMPYYVKKRDVTTFELSNQVSRIKDGCLTFPKTNLVLSVGEGLNGKFIHAVIKPYHDCFQVCVVCEVENAMVSLDGDRILGLDPGINNFLAVSNNCGLTPFIVNGKVMKSKNHYYFKEISRLQSCLKVCQGDVKSKKLDQLYRKRDCYFRDKFHKIACYRVDYCLKYSIGKIVYGRNKQWKQNMNLGHKTNQAFQFIPHYNFFSCLKEHCMKVGIVALEIEESYTSKASFLDDDFIPSYGASKLCSFSGLRVHRGLYRSKNGIEINADINGASNIIKKAVDTAFDTVADLSYLHKTVCKVTI